jgi:hypothetical protein
MGSQGKKKKNTLMCLQMLAWLADCWPIGHRPADWLIVDRPSHILVNFLKQVLVVTLLEKYVLFKNNSRRGAGSSSCARPFFYSEVVLDLFSLFVLQ